MNNSIVRIAKFAALMALGGTALMQAAQQATFHLSVVTHWGAAVLQPGDYKMFLPDESIGHKEVKIEGANRTVYVFPLVADSKEVTDSSQLDVKEIDGQYFVRGYRSGILGKEFKFYTPKPVHAMQAETKHADSPTQVN